MLICMIVVKQPVKSVTQDCCVLLLDRFPCVHLFQQTFGKKYICRIYTVPSIRPGHFL